MKKILFVIITMILINVAYANNELIIHGVSRNATDGNFTDRYADITIRLNSSGSQVYTQTQSNQHIDDGIYHVIFTGITTPSWFLDNPTFSIQIGSDIYSPKNIAPVPVSYASYWSNNSDLLDGETGSFYLDDTTIGNCSSSNSCGLITYDTELDYINNCSVANSCSGLTYDSELDYVNNCSVTNSCTGITYDSELNYINNCSTSQSCGTVLYWGDKTGNSTTEIRNQFSSSDNVSIVNGLVFLNISCETITGSADLCDGDDAIGGGGGGAGMWVDAGSYLYPNSTFASNIIVFGSISANDWSNVTIPFNNLLDATDDISISFANNKLTYSFVTPTDEGFEIEGTGAFGGDLVHIHQHTGNPSDTTLLKLHSEDSDVLPLNITGTNTNSIVSVYGNITLLNGGLYATDWNDVSITESQISDLTHTVDTTIGNCSGEGSCALITYDTELDYIGNCTGDLSCDNILYESELNTIVELNTQIADATILISGGTLTNTKWCVYDGTGIDCNVEPVSDTNTWNSTTDIQAVAVGGEVSGTVGSITLSNSALDDAYIELGDTFGGEVSGTYGAIVLDHDALDDQYYDSEADLTGLLDDNYEGELNNEAGLYSALSDVSLFLEDVVDDTTPTLGGNIDFNSLNATGVECIVFSSGGRICSG